MIAQEKGKAGEKMAEIYLESLGMRTLARNVRAAGAEVDLVMEDQGVLVLVEVKQRSRASAPRQAVDAAKQARICRAALAYLQRRGWLDRPARFDVVEVCRPGGELTCNHIPNAFPFRRGKYFI